MSSGERWKIWEKKSRNDDDVTIAMKQAGIEIGVDYSEDKNTYDGDDDDDDNDDVGRKITVVQWAG